MDLGVSSLWAVGSEWALVILTACFGFVATAMGVVSHSHGVGAMRAQVAMRGIECNAGRAQSGGLRFTQICTYIITIHTYICTWCISEGELGKKKKENEEAAFRLPFVTDGSVSCLQEI